MDKTKFNLAMLLEYDGSSFYGFQKQAVGRTIQTELENALSTIANSKIDVITSGRTDTGVHASYQVINFITDVERELYSWLRGTNALLPKDIAIREVKRAPDNFNARFNAISRTYHYYLVVDPVRPAILRSKVGWYHVSLNIPLIKEACAMLQGEKDFTSFRAADCQAQNPVRNLKTVKLEQKGNLLCFEFTANAFLYHMIRNIVGALIYVGNGKLSLDGLANLISAKSRYLAPPTFMPDGLYLAGVEYKEPFLTPAIKNWLF